MIDNETVRLVKETARIEEVVREHVELHRRGSSYVGLCPFHGEKTPSFHVNAVRGYFKCFGCGEGGDAITFVRKFYHLDFYDAIRWLANKYHIDIVEKEQTPEELEERRRRDAMLQLMQWVAEWMKDALHDNDIRSTEALAYLQNDFHVHESLIENQQLGYWRVNDTGDALVQAVKAQGFDIELLELLRLAIRNEENQWLDANPGTAVFPVKNNGNNVVAFACLKMEDKPQVVEPQRTAVYFPQKNLYGLNELPMSRVKECCYLVPSLEDVLMLQPLNLNGNVATLFHHQLDERYTPTVAKYPSVVLLCGSDAEDQKLMAHHLEVLLRFEANVKVVNCKSATWSQFVLEHTADEVFAYIENNALSFVDAVIQQYAMEDNDTILTHLTPFFKAVADAHRRCAYMNRCAKQLGLTMNDVSEFVNNSR